MKINFWIFLVGMLTLLLVAAAPVQEVLFPSLPVLQGGEPLDIVEALTPLELGFLLAAAVNRIVEYLKRPIETYLESKEIEFSWWWLIYPTYVMGGILSWLAGLNYFAGVFGNPVIGLVLTAAIVGGGANLINGIFGDN